MLARGDTTLNSAAAEHLVLGHLLMAGISAFKAYGNQPGFDLIASNPENGKAARVQIKSRYPNHHVLFDNGALLIDDDFSLNGKADRLLIQRDHAVGRLHLQYHRSMWL